MCRQKRPKVLLVTGGPWSSFLVAHRAFQRTGVPYVLDFRDSWTLTRNEDFEALRPRWASARTGAFSTSFLAMRKPWCFATKRKQSAIHAPTVAR